MITNWRTLAKKVSDKHDIPLEVVIAQLKLYAKEQHKAMTDNARYEYDYFGLGVLTPSIYKVRRDFRFNFDKEKSRKSAVYEFLKKKVAQMDIIKEHGKRKIKRKLVDFWK